MQAPILVSGCARSGTSLVAQIIHACGAWKGETVGPSQFNPDGFFENEHLREKVNKAILRANDCDPLGVKKLPDWDAVQYAPFKKEVLDAIEEQGYEGGPWMFKDAKLAYLARLWMREFPSARWVLTRRNPQAIVSSCLRTPFMKQNGGGDPHFWSEWVNKTTKDYLARIDETYGALVVDTDALIKGDFTLIRRAVEELGLKWDEEKVRGIVKPQHWNSKDINTSIPLNVPHEVIDKNVRFACRLAKQGKVQTLVHSPQNPGEIAIVGGGPSLKGNWQQVRDMQKAGVYILALNGAHNFLKKKKVIPNGCAVMDARASNRKFVQFPHKDCTYFVSSQCDQSLFATLLKKRAKVVVWHNDVGANTERIVDIHQGRRIPIVPTLGTTIGIRSMWLAYMLGFRKFHVFGLDSCIQGGKHHAYEQKENNEDVVVPLEIKTPAGTYRWDAAVWMVAQVQDFKMWVEQFKDVQWHIVDCPPLQAVMGQLPPPEETKDEQLDGMRRPEKPQVKEAGQVL